MGISSCSQSLDDNQQTHVAKGATKKDKLWNEAKVHFQRFMKVLIVCQ